MYEADWRDPGAQVYPAEGERLIERLTRGNRNAERKDITFVIGFPRNQAQRDQSRAAIQGNSSRIRWRKGSATPGALRAKRGLRDNEQAANCVAGIETITDPYWYNQANTPVGDLEVPHGNVPSALGPIDQLLLPPFLPLPHQGIMQADEVRSALQGGMLPGSWRFACSRRVNS